MIKESCWASIPLLNINSASVKLGVPNTKDITIKHRDGALNQ